MPSSTRLASTRSVPRRPFSPCGEARARVRRSRVWGSATRRPSHTKLTLGSLVLSAGCSLHSGGALNLWPRGHAPLRGAFVSVILAASARLPVCTCRWHDSWRPQSRSLTLTFFDDLLRCLRNPQVHDLELQVKRAYAQLQKQPTVILKQCVSSLFLHSPARVGP